MRYFQFSVVVFVLFFYSKFSVGQIIKVEESKYYDKISLKKLSIAIQLLDSILSTEAFKKEVLNANFVGTKGKSNQEIYEYLMSGNSKYDSSNDKVINLYLSEYSKYAGGNELGVTKGKKTRTHRCFVLKNDVRCFAGHLLHEYCHVMGFGHHNISSERPKLKTVPYVIGNIVKKMLLSPKCIAVKDTCH